jgi:hypothetical protein
MKKKIIVKVDFCKTFEINNIINPIITSLVSYQMGCLMAMGYHLGVQGNNLFWVKFSCG